MKILGMLLALFCAGAGTAAFAQGNKSPFDLSISMDGEQTEVVLTLDELDALPQVAITTSTIWTEGEVAFSGPSLSSVLDAAGQSGTDLKMTALNDYSISMPVAEIGEQFPIVATSMNGQPISVRDKGPYWIVYPYDSAAEYQNETVYSRSIWQLSALTLR